ncbi:MAG: 16S rRNA (guanine(527)-N(7))-methyltransferase RsmG [Bacteroidales bacterium]|nr:16S rRNA (guanine(527)-N(7))-methyltransferase RsmG [Candidatus Physcousia equi]
MNENIIWKYFPQLTDEQKTQYAQLGPLYREWNEKINVISRKDIDNLFEHHVLHSLGIAQVIRFKPGSKVIDLGCGGGFPGIPLAIMFPDTHFLLVDSVRKKTTVCQEVASTLGLKNVEVRWTRAEEVKEKVDFVVSRAVMPQNDLVKLIRKNIRREQNNGLPNGLISLKGGVLDEELRPISQISEVTPLSDIFEEEFFETKSVVYTMIKA